jgi:hypothetical protein
MIQYVPKYGYAESLQERGMILYDKSQVVGDPLREMLFDLR